MKFSPRLLLSIIPNHAQAKKIALDMMLIAGGGSITYGISLIYVPAAWIFAGILLLVTAILINRGTANNANRRFK